MNAKQYKICQQFKKRFFYIYLPPKIFAELKLWDLVHIDLIGPYSKSIRQHHTGGTIINRYVSLACMKNIKPDKSWFEIIKITMFNINKILCGDDEYINN